MRLWDPGARAEAKVAANAAKMEAKLAADSAVGSFVTRLHNEVASASTSHGTGGGGRMTGGGDVSSFISERLESERPHGRGRRSTDADGNGHGREPMFARGGVWSANTPNIVTGERPFQRWPNETLIHVEQVNSAPAYEPWPYTPPPGGPACQCGYC